MIIRDEKNQVIGITVRWNGTEVTITKDTFAGGKRPVPLDVIMLTLDPARHDPEVRAFVQEIIENV